MKTAQYARKGKIIINLTTGEKHTHRWNNQAKRASRKIQMEADGALGRGTLRVIPT
jgi:hypothetical protein